MKKDTSETLTVHEVAKILGIGINQAYMAAKSGSIPIIKIGNRILVPKVALNRMLEDAANSTLRPQNEK